MPGDDEYERLKQSIQAFGYVDPIIINSDGTVIGGHQRLNVLKDLGYKEADVAVVDLDKNEEKALNIALNKISGEWDEDKLTEILSELAEEEFPIELTGFSEEELQSILKDYIDDAETEIGFFDDEYEPDVNNENPKSKRGEIYKLGEHRVMCGDSTSKDDVKRLMDGEKADITFTSPPYNVGGNLGYDGKDSKYVNNDDNIEDYLVFLKKFAQNAMDNSIFTFINIQQLANNKVDLAEFVYEFRDKLAETIIWDKGHAAPAMAANVLNSVFEYIYVFSEKANRSIGTKEFRNVDNIVRISRQQNNEYSDIHNATFPLEFAHFFVNTFSTESVLDLFGGTGTTLIACEQSGRKCFMMEYEPLYVDIIIDRWERYTGEKAVLLS